jgi:hypothetical protein
MPNGSARRSCSDFKSFTENFGATLTKLSCVEGDHSFRCDWLVAPLRQRHRLDATSASVGIAALGVAILCTSSPSGVSLPDWTVTEPLRVDGTRAFRFRWERRRIESELQYLQAKERQIIGYLLAKKQKMIEVQPDGEDAATLIAKGFLVQPRQGEDPCLVQ